MSLTINNRKIGKESAPYIIAELSANHNGSLQRALDTIDAAHECGADAIKLQTYTPDTMTIDCDMPDFYIRGGLWDGYKLYDLYRDAHTPFEWHGPLFEHARKRGITVFSTPFDESAVDLLESLNPPAYKIASFELTDLPLIQYVAKTGKPMIMSTGMASEAEIDEAVSTAKKAGCSDIILLHCISSYPTPLDQANLRQIPELAARFGSLVGLSDHTMGVTASVASVALGTCVIEKHFTLSRADKGPDSDFSLDPREFKNLCLATKEAWLTLGSATYKRQKSEDISNIFRRSIYFVKNLPKGHIVGPGDIRRIRPGLGLPPKHYQALIGRHLSQDVSAGQRTSLNCFE